MITCVFGELIDGKVKEKGTMVKMARGEMVRYMAENHIEDLEDIKNFDRLGYAYAEPLSDQDVYKRQEMPLKWYLSGRFLNLDIDIH